MKQSKRFILLLILSMAFLTHTMSQNSQEIKLQTGSHILKKSHISEAKDGGGKIGEAIGSELGLYYSIPLDDHLWYHTGLNYFYSNYINFVTYWSGHVSIYSFEFRTISVPMEIGYDITHWLQINGGISLDWHINREQGDEITNQSGVSLKLAPTFIYNLSEELDVYARLNYSHYSFINFKNVKYPDRMMTYGVSIGISKKIK